MITTIEERDGRTRMTQLSQFTSVAQLEELLAMGQEQGMIEALTQIDAILLADASRCTPSLPRARIRRRLPSQTADSQ